MSFILQQVLVIKTDEFRYPIWSSSFCACNLIHAHKGDTSQYTILVLTSKTRLPTVFCDFVSLKNLSYFQAQNSDYYSQYVTEDISDYIERKRYLGVHGNHLEIQALSEMYNRPIHIYCYSAGNLMTLR